MGIVTFFKKRRAMLMARKWEKKTDSSIDANYIVTHHFEDSDVFIDLYWSIKRKTDMRRMAIINHRCTWQELERVIKGVEEKEVPAAISKLKEK